MPGEPTQYEILRLVQLAPDWTIRPAQTLSQLGGEQFYLLLIPLLLWFGRWDHGVMTARALIVSDLLGEWIKWALRWPRPDRTWALSEETSPGFVSTHAALSLALVVCLWNRWPKGRPLLVVWVLGVGWSRLRLGVHFPLDVLGGWALGALVALTAIKLKNRYLAKYIWVALALLCAFSLSDSGWPSWQRDLGLLFGLEFGVVLWDGRATGQPRPLNLAPGLIRLVLVFLAYFGLQVLGWPRLLRYLVVGLIISLRFSDHSGRSTQE